MKTKNFEYSQSKRPGIRKIYVVSIPIAIFGIITVFLAIGAASYGARLVSLEETASSLEKEYRALSSELVGATSLSEISIKTEDLGYSKPVNIIYISEEGAVAKLVQ